MQTPRPPQPTTPSQVSDAPWEVLIVVACVLLVVVVGLMVRSALEMLRRRRARRTGHSGGHRTPTNPLRRAVVLPAPDSRAGSAFVPNAERTPDAPARRHVTSASPPAIPRPRLKRDDEDRTA